MYSTQKKLIVLLILILLFINYGYGQCVKGNYHFEKILPPPEWGYWTIGNIYPTLYSDIGYGGDKKPILSNIPDLGQGVARSMLIPSIYEVTIYECKNYEGTARTFKESYGTLPSDFYAGSIKIKNSESIPNKVLNAHNYYRFQVTDTNHFLVWSPSLATSAQQWANYLSSTGQFKHDPNCSYGENIAWGVSDIESAVHYWATEKPKFKNGVWNYCGKCKCPGDCQVSTTCDWCNVGHYSQIVWEDTKEVGCGISNGIVVCRYNPPGNMGGQKAY
jgi:hypothetical protein